MKLFRTLSRLSAPAVLTIATSTAVLMGCESGSSSKDAVESEDPDTSDGQDGNADQSDTDGTSDGTDGATDATDGNPDATDSVDGSTDAVDGATDAVDGSTDAVDGATDSVDGTTDAVDGATDSVDGTTDAVDGATDSSDGATDGTEGTDIGDETWPASVTQLTLDGAGKAKVTGNPSPGQLPGAEWMLEDDVHCLSGTSVSGSSAKLYQKNHAFYALKKPLPAYSRVTATVTATAGDPRVYLFAKPKGQYAVPPTTGKVSACAARYNPGYDGKPITAGWNNETGNEYEVFIGVAGGDFDKNFFKSDFTLDVAVAPLPSKCHDGPFDDSSSDVWTPVAPAFWPDFVEPVSVDAEGRAQRQGQLADGLPLCYSDFAWSSNVACFPQPQAYLYSGNQKFYALTIPKAGVTTVTITPDPGVDVSAYGLQMSTTSWYTPPHVPSAICEQSPLKNFATVGGPGAAESLTFVSTGNPYNVLIAVAGADGATEGGYTLDVDQQLVAGDTCGDLWSQAKLGAFPTKATDWYPAVTMVKPDASGKVTVSGNLSSGKSMCSLAFASKSNVTCFPATQNVHFGGNHVFYAVDGGVGPGQTLTVTVTPKNANVDVSLYGYWMSTGSFYVPPNVVSVGNCDASHALTLDGSGNPGSPEWIYFENPGGNSYNYFFAVAGPTGVTAGDFDVTVVRTTPPPPFCPESLPGTTYSAWPSNIPQIIMSKEGTGAYSGDLADGACTNLSFANSSQVACFPATQNDNFEGNQVFHVIEQEMPPHSVLDITVTPKPGVDISVYGYMLGSGNVQLPPNVPTALACEASYSTKTGGNPGVAETLHFENPTDSNSYQVFLAVSGVAGVTSGGYDIDVVMDVAEPFCEESLPGPTVSSWPANVQKLTEDGTGKATATGSLTTGSCANLEFASDSDVACFPATEFDNFMGPQVFYALSKPLAPGEVVDITVTPDPEVDVSLYGYETGSTTYYVPPKVTSVVACESSYDAISSWNPGEPEYIHFENPTGNSYNIFFAVTGTTQSTEGGFKVDVVRKAAPAPHCAASLPGSPQSAWPAKVTQIGVMNGVGSAAGNLNTGACSNLDFASDSGVACFPATQNSAFQGNLVHYALSEPLPPNSTASIEVIPAAGVDVSLFGYTTATTSFFVPPYVPSVSVCEASYSTGAPNPGASEWITFSNPTGNSYNVFFSVAGPAGVTAGAFTVKVKVETAEPHCPDSLPGSSGLTAWPTGVTKLTLMGTTATGSANLNTGACTSLDFASDSSNACFPATQSDLFEGNHLFYALSAPVPANKTVTIELTPGPQADLALYGYRTSSTSYYVPPYVPSTVDCEYSAATGKGVKETIVFPASGGTNPYNVFFGVAGASGVTGGNVTVNVTVQ